MGAGSSRGILAGFALAFATLMASATSYATELELVDTFGATSPFSMRDVVASPDGRHVYALVAGDFSSFDEETIVTFVRDLGTGELHHEGRLLRHVSESASLAVTPDGRHLYTASFSGEVEVFGRDSTSGALVSLGASGNAGVGSFNDRIVVAPDGDHVYSIGSHSVRAFERDRASGLLSEVDADVSPIDDPQNLSVAVSPNGRNLYVGEWGGVLVYEIGAEGASIDQRQRLGASSGLADLIGINIDASPDGRSVYVTSANDAVFSFRRDEASGELDGLGRVDGSGMKTDLGVIEVSPNGTRVYVTGTEVPDINRLSDGISVFARDPSTGRLTYIETRVGYPPNWGLFRPGGLAFGAEGRDVYVGMAAAGNVGLFRSRTTCDPTPRTSCRAPTKPRRSRLRLKDASNDRKDGLIWTWTRGEATDASAVGDPLFATDYAFCVYDHSETGWAVRFEALLPAGESCGGQSCWTVVGAAGASLVKFQDATGERAAGIRALEIRTGDSGTSSIRLKGKGLALPMASLPLAQTPTVVAQLVNRAAECWGAQFSAPAPSNGTRHFNDRSD